MYASRAAFYPTPILELDDLNGAGKADSLYRKHIVAQLFIAGKMPSFFPVLFRHHYFTVPQLIYTHFLLQLLMQITTLPPYLITGNGLGVTITRPGSAPGS